MSPTFDIWLSLIKFLIPHPQCLNTLVHFWEESRHFSWVRFHLAFMDPLSNFPSMDPHPAPGLSVQFSRSVVSDSLRPHELQHTRPPCPSPTPGVHPNPNPSSQWCHPTISSSVIPFSSYPQSFPTSGFFPMSWLFASGGQSIGA